MGEAEEKVAQLREIADIDDQAARQLLNATNWNLEEAIGLHFAGGSDGAVGDDSVGGGHGGGGPGAATATEPPPLSVPDAHRGRPRKRPMESDSEGEVEAARRAQPSPEEEDGWFSSLGRRATGVMQTVFGIASEDFEHWFVSRFGTPSPQFSTDCYSEAVKCALHDDRLLLIWFHQDEGSPTEALCREILQNPIMLRIIRRCMILWAGDVSRFEPAQMARLLNVTVFPSLVVCRPFRSAFDGQGLTFEWPLGTFAQPLFRLSPEEQGLPIGVDQALATLTSAAEDHYDAIEIRQAETIRREVRVAEDRRLREEQDREFEESLLQDQIAAVRRSEEFAAAAGAAANSSQSAAEADAAAEFAAKAEEAAKAAAEAEATAAAAAAEEAAKALKEEQRQARGREISGQAEPTAANGTVAKISLKLVAGERMQRTFLASQTIDEVYEWAHCCRPAPTPWNFELLTSFPTKVLSDRTATLAESGLSPSAALLMKSMDD